MITCEQSRDAVVMAAFGELGADALADLKRHLESCAACAEQARDIESARRLVAEAEGHAMPAAFSPPRAGARARWMKLVPMAAAAAILVGVLGLAMSWSLWQSGETGEPEAGPRLASGSLALDADAHGSAQLSGSDAASEDVYLGDDGFGDEIESLQSELTSLESKVGEF